MANPAEPACTPDPANALTSEIMTTVDDAYDAAWKLGASHADALGASMHALVTALADRLLPADAETRTEWGVRVTPDSGEPYLSLPGLGMLMTQQIAEGFAVVASRTPGVANAEVLTRKAWDGPWLPAPTEES